MVAALAATGREASNTDVVQAVDQCSEVAGQEIEHRLMGQQACQPLQVREHIEQKLDTEPSSTCPSFPSRTALTVYLVYLGISSTIDFFQHTIKPVHHDGEALFPARQVFYPILIKNMNEAILAAELQS